MKTGSAFSLIELLVATTLSVLLIALVAGTLLHTARSAAVTREVLAMHDNAAATARILGERLQAQQPSTSWHLEAGPGVDGTWGTGDETCSLTFMAATANRMDRGGGFQEADFVALDWYRLRWTGPDAQGLGSGLTWADTEGRRESVESRPGGTARWPDPSSTNPNFGYKLRILPEPRRDRRRDLDDNDGRLIEGMTPSLYQYLGSGYWDGGVVRPLRGDQASLDQRATPLVHATTTVSDFALGWIDRAGWETRFDPALGIVRRNASGSPVPAPTDPLLAPWLSQTRCVLDGVFVDARRHSLNASDREVGDARPALLRLAYTLTRPPPPESRAREPIVQRFSFAIPLQPGLPPPASAWTLGAP